MKKDFYLFRSGELKRKDNSLSYITEDRRFDIPIETVEDIYLFGKTNFNVDLLCFISDRNIFLHIYDFYGNYKSTISPSDAVLSGVCKVNQVNKYKNNREYISSVILSSAKNTIIQNLKEYNIDTISVEKCDFNKDRTIEEMMGIEGNMRKYYYKKFNDILNRYEFNGRNKQPPLDEINCLMSFGNSLCYNTCLKAIHKTQLDSTISFLHEPGYRRHSLSLDIAEIFKPLIVDRVIFKLVNKKIITDDCFIKDDNKCYLNEKGKKIFVKEYEDKLSTTIYHKKLKRKVSFERLIVLECFKLLKYINEDVEYKPFKMWW